MALNMCRKMLGSSDLEQGVRLLLLSLALLAEVKVRSACALEPDSPDWMGLASITGNTLMDYLGLFYPLILEVLLQHLLEDLGSLGSYLLLQNLHKMRHRLACLLATSESPSVPLGTLTFDGVNLLFLDLLLVL